MLIKAWKSFRTIWKNVLKLSQIINTKLFFLFFFILLLSEFHIIFKKRICKKYLIRFDGSSDSKVILILFMETIVFFGRSIIINVGRPSFKRPVSDFFYWCLGLGLKEYLNDLLKIFFYIKGSIIYESLMESNKKFIRRLKFF